MKPIPKNYDPELFEKIVPSHSKFIKLESCKDFDVKMEYPLRELENSISDCYIREELLEMLLKAGKLLPDGIRLRILDAWRPMALQRELYEFYSESIIKKFNLKNQPEANRLKIITQYISYPNDDILLPPVHTTGGAVDLTLIDDNGSELDMGTEFDSFSIMSRTDYFESNSENPEARDNRRILYNAMIGAGFTNLPSEWWHFDFGNRFWAYYNQKPAIYEGVFSKGGINYEK